MLDSIIEVGTSKRVSQSVGIKGLHGDSKSRHALDIVKCLLALRNSECCVCVNSPHVLHELTRLRGAVRVEQRISSTPMLVSLPVGR